VLNLRPATCAAKLGKFDTFHRLGIRARLAPLHGKKRQLSTPAFIII
jgi:hypothetical protein